MYEGSTLPWSAGDGGWSGAAVDGDVDDTDDDGIGESVEGGDIFAAVMHPWIAVEEGG